MNIKEKIYYKIKFSLTSPLALSSGENNYADKDLIRDAKGKPYIPASSIAGVCKSAINKEMADNYFGFVEKATRENSDSVAEDSRLIFYDAVMCKGQEPVISIRDGVGLDEYKTAIDGAKYDIEVLEPGIKFITYIEQNITEDKKDNIANILIDIMKSGSLSFGGKTMRGYGTIKVDESDIFQKKFDLTNKSGASEWIDFNMYDNPSDKWEKYENSSYKSDSTKKTIVLSLKQRFGISIRKYTTTPAKSKNNPEPDYEQLTVSGNKPVPTIPGTSWAGAFKHRMTALGLSEKDIESLFGFVGVNKSKKSRIYFSETLLEGANPKEMSRNAIDRFSGGTVDGALFTDRTYYNGETELTITVDCQLNEEQIKTLSATIADLNYGFLAIGGLTSIGRGLFSIEAINGRSVKDEDVYWTVKDILSKEEVSQ